MVASHNPFYPLKPKFQISESSFREKSKSFKKRSKNRQFDFPEDLSQRIKLLSQIHEVSLRKVKFQKLVKNSKESFKIMVQEKIDFSRAITFCAKKNLCVSAYEGELPTTFSIH